MENQNSIIATSNGGSNYEIITQGNYPARCYSMVHIGTVEELILGVLKKLNKVRITWELPTEKKVFKEEDGEQPYSISKEYTLSMHEKSTLRGHLKNWRGKDFTEEEAKHFDITKLLGVACMINVTHKTSKDGQRTYAEIGSISTMPKGFECPPQINPIFVFNYSNFDINKFNTLPEYLRNKIVTSEEYKKLFSNDVDLTNSHFEMTNEIVQPGDDMPF